MSNNEVFGSYSEYYNLLYQDKDYQSEVDYVHNLICDYNTTAHSLLDLGCGTGLHDFRFKDKGYAVTGVDLSDKMIELAQRRRMETNEDMDFIVGDVRNIRLQKKFDVVTSLFHVASYQTTTPDLEAFIKTAYEHLEKDGIFIFSVTFRKI